MGGNAGQVGWPEYLQSHHFNWLGNPSLIGPDTNITELINAAHAVGGNPYEGEVAYDPSSRVAQLLSSTTGFEDAVKAINVINDMSGLSSEAKGISAVWTESALDSKFATIMASAMSKVSTINVALDGHDNVVTEYIAGLTEQVATDMGVLLTGLGNSVRAELTKIVAYAIEQYTDVLKGTLVKDLVREYELSTEDAWDKGVAAFIARTHGVVSLNNSAVVLGLAAMSRDRARDLAAKRLEFGTKYVPDSNSMIQMLTNMFASSVGSWGLVGNYDQLFGSLYDKMLSTLGKAFENYMAGYGAVKQTQSAWVEKNLAFMSDLHKSKFELLGRVAGVQMETYTKVMAAEADQKDKDLEIDAAYAKFPFDVYQWSTPVLGAMNGVQPIPKEPSKGQRLLGGAAGGAGIGFMVGGPVGAGIGALLGAAGSQLI